MTEGHEIGTCCRRFLGLALLIGLHPTLGSPQVATLVAAGTLRQVPGPLRVDFSGRVADQADRPVRKANVEVNGAEAVTDDNGIFELTVAPASRFILNISHPDFADLSYITRTSVTKHTWRLVRAQVATVDPRGSITLVDTRPDLKAKGIGGATFVLLPNSLVDGQGQAPSGPVRGAIATLDIARGEGPGDWAVRSDDGRQDGYLVSFGAVFIQFTDPTGRVRYQLRNGRTGQLTLPTIPAMRSHAPATPVARFWYYDTRDGYWKQTGTARFDRAAGVYTGTVDHLSTLNTDIAKFDNAACLSVTLDPSVALGNTLRIRYHSSGTPFGQTPTFVMNDTLNAAYRLPANTNILLELLNASDEAFGNLVVQDPPGTPLVNTVVNTGPPIPSGNSLWPPPPFTDCKPVTLALGLPEVEIRINEVMTDEALKDNPSDDYVTWAPTFCRARLTSPIPSTVNVVLTNDVPGRIPGGGDVLFAAHATPWPASTTATANDLALTLPGDGSWVPFVIAGKFGTPSTNDKDVIIAAHQNTAAGAVLGTKALMVRVRKNANTLTASERSRFLFAWRAFRNKAGVNYGQFQEMHRLVSSAGDEGHMQPAFLSWHRVMLLHVERELQKLDPSVALHYWNWDAAAPNVFTEDFMGAPGSGGGVTEPVFATTNPMNGWNTDLPFSGGELRRNTDDHTADPAGAMKPLDHPVDPSLMVWTDYGPTTEGFSFNSFSDEVEKLSHNPAHGWPCGGGHLFTPNRSAADPLFYLLHSQIDRQWAYWQWKKNRHGSISGGTLSFPAPAHYDNNGTWNAPGGSVTNWDFRQKGSFLDDGLWPWDGTTGGTSMTLEWRPPNQATAPGINVPLSMPLVPNTAFPASVRRNLWPSAPIVPTNAHTIDYLGRFVPVNGLGFAYDDVPY